MAETEGQIQPIIKQDTNTQACPRGQKILSLLVTIALIISMSTGYVVLDLKRHATRSYQSIDQQIHYFQEKIQILNTALNEQNAAHTTAVAQLSSQVQQLEQKFTSSLKQYLNQNNEWLLLRVRYYLELAQMNAHWQADRTITLALLKQADALLADIQDQRVFNIRQQMAKDIEAIKALPELDTIGLLSQLDAVQQQLKLLTIEIPQLSQALSSSSSPQSWRMKLNNSLESLKQLVVIRRNDINTPPLLTSAQKDIWLQMIQLELQEAQWAVLQKNEPVFQLALNQALRTIQQNFTLNDARTKSVVNTLQNLKKTLFVSHFPDLSQSLQLLNQLITAESAPKKINAEGAKL